MILIIGAGPVGCYAASLLAKEHEVLVVEEHPSVGKPIQCTGIVTSEIFGFVPKKNDFVVNKIKFVNIFSPNEKSITVKFKNQDIILDREKFDKYFYKKAKLKGVKFLFKHRFISFKNSVALVKNLKTGKIKKIKINYLIGADGPNSFVGKNSKLITKRKFHIGMQAVIKKRNNNSIDFYPYEHGYGWAVPESKATLRVGVATEKNVKNYYDKLIKKYPGRIISTQGGMIPLYNPKENFSEGNIFLVGDAAGFVKATTGGGLIPGLRSAELVAEAILKNKNYSKLIKKHLHMKLLMHLKKRKIMNKFSEKDWNNLIEDFSSEKTKKVLASVSRERPIKLSVKLLFSKPGLVKYALKNLKEIF